MAGDGVAIFGTLRLLESTLSANIWVRYYLYLLLCFVILSSAFVMVSFIPQVRTPWVAPRRRPTERDNLFFYGAIAHYDAGTYLAAISSSAGGGERQDFGRLERDLAAQIIINSRITVRKLALFTWAIWLTFTGVFTPVGAGAVYAIIRIIHGGEE